MKKAIAIFAVILIAAAAVTIYSTSNLSRKRASAVFSKRDNFMNTLTIDAPYGYYVIRYSVVPRWPENEAQPFKVGGGSFPNNPIGLYGGDVTHSNMFPSKGELLDIPLETHIRLASDLNTAATAELPTNQKILERCGQYVYVTKNPVTMKQLEEMVSGWTLDDPVEVEE